MAKLVAHTPFGDCLPVTIGDVTLTEGIIDRAWSVAPFIGKRAEVSSRLKAALGVSLPKAGYVTAKGETRAIWMSGDQSLVLSPTLPDLVDVAAVTDQADGLAAVIVAGTGAEAVLARLVPVDLRQAHFGKLRTARTMIGHMMGSVTRIAPDSYEVMVMRSMAGTLVHDLERAAHGRVGR